MYQDEQSQKYIISTFAGTNQSIDDSQMQPGESKNNQNFKTSDGVLEVTEGYGKYVATPVPGGIKSMMVYYSHNTDGTTTKQLLAASGTTLYRLDGSSWTTLKTGLASGDFDFINYYKGLEDWLIFCNGKDATMRYNGTTVSNLANAPKGTSIGLHYHRIFITGNPAEPDSVYYSAAANPEDWTQTLDTGGIEVFATWDGGRCEGLSTIFDDVVVFKTYDAWKLVGTYPGEYEHVRLYSAVGSIARNSIVDCGNTSLFLDKSGIYIYDGVKTVIASDKVKEIIKNMNKTYAKNATAVFFDNRYIVALPEGNSTRNNVVIELDLVKKQFTVKRGFQVNDFLVYDDKLLFCNDSGYVLEYDSGEAFDDNPIEAFWETPETSFGSLSSTKRSTYLYLDIEYMTGPIKVQAIF